MKKHIPNFLTCCNLMVGAVGIVECFSSNYIDLTFWFILTAGIFDFLDGLAARLLGVQSSIGKQLDSLADLVSFGVLPGVYVSQWIVGAYSKGGRSSIAASSFISSYQDYLLYFGLLIIVFSAIRLAKFNIADNQDSEFLGLPTPANAIMLTTIGSPFVLTSIHWSAVAIVSCFLLVSNIRMIAFKFKSMAWAGNELRYLLLILLAVGFVVFQLSFIPFVIPTYIAFSILGNYLLQPVLFK